MAEDIALASDDPHTEAASKRKLNRHRQKAYTYRVLRKIRAVK